MGVEVQDEKFNKSCDTEDGEAVECGRKVNIGQPCKLLAAWRQ